MVRAPTVRIRAERRMWNRRPTRAPTRCRRTRRTARATVLRGWWRRRRRRHPPREAGGAGALPEAEAVGFQGGFFGRPRGDEGRLGVGGPRGEDFAVGENAGGEAVGAAAHRLCVDADADGRQGDGGEDGAVGIARVGESDRPRARRVGCGQERTDRRVHVRRRSHPAPSPARRRWCGAAANGRRRRRPRVRHGPARRHRHGRHRSTDRRCRLHGRCERPFLSGPTCTGPPERRSRRPCRRVWVASPAQPFAACPFAA